MEPGQFGPCGHDNAVNFDVLDFAFIFFLLAERTFSTQIVVPQVTIVDSVGDRTCIELLFITLVQVNTDLQLGW